VATSPWQQTGPAAYAQHLDRLELHATPAVSEFRAEAFKFFAVERPLVSNVVWIVESASTMQVLVMLPRSSYTAEQPTFAGGNVGPTRPGEPITSTGLATEVESIVRVATPATPAGPAAPAVVGGMPGSAIAAASLAANRADLATGRIDSRQQAVLAAGDVARLALAGDVRGWARAMRPICSCNMRLRTMAEPAPAILPPGRRPRP
jgi:hypothetical protein